MQESNYTFKWRKIKAYKPRSTPYRIFEKGSDRGFNVQVMPSGSKLFSLAYYFDDKRKFLSLARFNETDKNDDGSLATARKRAQAARELINNDIDPRAQAEEEKLQRKLEEEARNIEAAKGSVEQLFDMYCKKLEHEGKPSHREARRALTKDALPYVKDKKANEVTSGDITLILSKVCDRGSLIMGNRLRAYLSAAFGFGLKHDHNPRNLNADVQFHLETNPALAVAKPIENEESRERVLSADEIQELWHMLDESGLSIHTQTIIKLMLTTGQRVREITGAAWDEFDLQKGEWVIPKARTKNRKHAHLVPLNKTSLKLLLELQPITGRGKYLFPAHKPKTKAPMPESSVTKAVQRLCKREGFELFTPRDLRRTVKTMLAEMGVEKEIRDRIMNHALRGDVSERHYNQYDYLKEKKSALSRWASRLTSILNDTQTKSSIIQFPV